MISARKLLILNFILLSGCAQEQQNRGSVAQQEACRQRADEVFLRQNPNEQYRADLYVSGQRDTPFGGTGYSDPTAGLSARYARDKLLDNCLRNATAKPADRPATARP
jgi:hypothetical protein